MSSISKGAELTGDTVDNNKSTISDTEGSSDFTGEINVTRRVDQVDKETLLVLVTLVRVGDEDQILLLQFKEHRDGTKQEHMEVNYWTQARAKCYP